MLHPLLHSAVSPGWNAQLELCQEESQFDVFNTHSGNTHQGQFHVVNSVACGVPEFLIIRSCAGSTSPSGVQSINQSTFFIS